MGYTTACDIAFGVFVVSWLATRHVLYMLVCWSIYHDAPIDMAPGCYLTSSPYSTSPNTNTSLFIPASNTAAFAAHGGNTIWPNLLKAYTDQNGPICWNPSIRYYFLALLLTLQVFCCIWFSMVVKIVYKVLNGASADDVRSDDECDEEDEDVAHDRTRSILNAVPTCTESGMSAMPTYKEEEVGVDALTFARMNGASQRRVARRESSRASGISLPGGDRKELLGRIGCDKPT
jgi:acyl-CoA-dependent ceramide synthase